MTDPRCRSGKQCVRLTTDGAALTTQPGTICHGCVEEVQKCLDALPHLATALKTMKGSWGGVSYEARVTGSKEPPTPLHVGIVDLIDEIWAVTSAAEGYKAVDLVTLTEGVDRALRIRHVHAKAANAVGFDKVWQRRAAPCPECRMPTLGQWIGDDLIICSSQECLASFTKTEYENFCFTESQTGKRKN